MKKCQIVECLPMNEVPSLVKGLAVVKSNIHKRELWFCRNLSMHVHKMGCGWS